MSEPSRPPIFEPSTLETAIAIQRTLVGRLDDPNIVRANKDSGLFVLDDASKDSHSRNTAIRIFRGLDTEYAIITLSEGFTETDSRSKPSVLTVEFELNDRLEGGFGEGDYGLIMALPRDSQNLAPLARTRYDQLIKGAIPRKDHNIVDDGSYRYEPSEIVAQDILKALQDMKVYVH